MMQYQLNNNEIYEHRGEKNDQNAITHLSGETACVFKPPAAGLIIWHVIFDNYGGKNLWLFEKKKKSGYLWKVLKYTLIVHGSVETYEVGSSSQNKNPSTVLY